MQSLRSKEVTQRFPKTSKQVAVRMEPLKVADVQLLVQSTVGFTPGWERAAGVKRRKIMKLVRSLMKYILLMLTCVLVGDIEESA
jgi:hypothetical protein